MVSKKINNDLTEIPMLQVLTPIGVFFIYIVYLIYPPTVADPENSSGG